MRFDLGGVLGSSSWLLYPCADGSRWIWSFWGDPCTIYSLRLLGGPGNWTLVEKDYIYGTNTFNLPDGPPGATYPGPFTFTGGLFGPANPLGAWTATFGLPCGSLVSSPCQCFSDFDLPPQTVFGTFTGTLAYLGSQAFNALPPSCLAAVPPAHLPTPGASGWFADLTGLVDCGLGGENGTWAVLSPLNACLPNFEFFISGPTAECVIATTPPYGQPPAGQMTLQSCSPFVITAPSLTFIGGGSPFGVTFTT
jgi:hypothetical protein